MPILAGFKLLTVLAVAVAAAAPISKDQGKYEQLTGPCKDAVAIGERLTVSSVDECEQQCDKQAAEAPGTGQPTCMGVNTDGKSCDLESQCNVRT